MMSMYDSHFVDLSFFVKKSAGLRFVSMYDSFPDMVPMYDSHFVDLSFFVKKSAVLRFVSTYPIAIFPSR